MIEIMENDNNIDKRGNTGLTCLSLSRLEWYVARTVKTYDNKNEVRLDITLIIYHQMTRHADVQTITAITRFDLVWPKQP